MPRSRYSGQFKKDIGKIEKSGGKDIEKLKAVVRKLVGVRPLEGRPHDHALTGGLKGHRDCHIEPDWILVYRIDRDLHEITFVRTGSHSELFG